MIPFRKEIHNATFRFISMNLARIFDIGIYILLVLSVCQMCSCFDQILKCFVFWVSKSID